jgi:hypothetical protein
MSQSFNRTLANVLRVPLQAIGSVIGFAYKIMFGKADARRSKKLEDDLALEIQRELAFLFNEAGARIVRDEKVRYPRPFDYAIVTVAVQGFLLRFIRGRGELRVQVGWEDSSSWADLNWVLKEMVGDNGRPLDSGMFNSLPDVSNAVRPSLGRIADAFSLNRRIETEKNISSMQAYERAVAKQWSTEINRKLYPEQ